MLIVSVGLKLITSPAHPPLPLELLLRLKNYLLVFFNSLYEDAKDFLRCGRQPIIDESFNFVCLEHSGVGQRASGTR